MDPRAAAIAMARDAAADHREVKRRRMSAKLKLLQLRVFCDANGIDYSEIRTEASGHGPINSDTRRTA